MTLALATSIFKSLQYNHELSIKFYVEWLSEGRFGTVDHSWDVGHSTRMSLKIWKSKMSDMAFAQASVNAQLDREEFSGNGSLMRIVPIGVWYWRDVGQAREFAREQSKVTHPSLACVEACEAYTELVALAMNGESSLLSDLCSDHSRSKANV